MFVRAAEVPLESSAKKRDALPSHRPLCTPPTPRNPTFSVLKPRSQGSPIPCLSAGPNGREVDLIHCLAPCQIRWRPQVHVTSSAPKAVRKASGAERGRKTSDLWHESRVRSTGIHKSNCADLSGCAQIRHLPLPKLGCWGRCRIPQLRPISAPKSQERIIEASAECSGDITPRCFLKLGIHHSSL